MNDQLSSMANDEVLKTNRSVNAKNQRILPALSEKYNRDYYVLSNTIDIDTLRHSGYRISHVANIVMHGRTRKNWALNPHSKMGSDATTVGIEGMDFKEYLKLFENSTDECQANTDDRESIK